MSKILVYGMGKSGLYAAKLGVLKNYEVDICDAKPLCDNALLRGEEELLSGISHAYFECLPDMFENLNAAADYYDFVVVAPGVNPNKGILNEFQQAGGRVISEPEFAYLHSHGEFIGITGTNGKTTTTTLCYEIFKREFKDRVRLVGNVGIPISAEILDEIRTESFDRIYICELSSYQLEYIDKFHCEIAAILNITPDHLERHGDMQGYCRAKYRIAQNSNLDENDKLILNLDDKILKTADFPPQDIIGFATREKSAHYILHEDKLAYRLGEEIVDVLDVSKLHIFGEHNYSNALCAMAIALEYGVSLESVKQAMMDFQPIEHRMEFVAKIDGVCYYNDSKATNPEASIPALLSMKEDTVLIAGGSDKKSDYRPWIAKFEKIALAILIGDTARDIADAMKEAGFSHYEFAIDMKMAIERAKEYAAQNENVKNVLLSPACASFDMYDNYECRGRDFKDIVREIARS